MTTTVKANTRAALLSAVPSLLGYIPRESLVYLPMKGTQITRAMRLDLPKDAPDFGIAVQALILRIGTDAGILIAYSDAPEGYAEMVAGVSDSTFPHVDIVEELWVSSTEFGSYLADGPAQPASLIQIDPTLGHVAPTNEPEALPVLDEYQRGLFSTATEAQNAAGFPAKLLPHYLEGLLMGDDDERTPGIAAGVLASFFEKPVYRDIILGTLAHGVEHGRAAVKAQEDWEQGKEYPDAVAAFMMGQGPRPDVKRLEAGLKWARLAASGGMAGALSVCAWISWALGRSTHALRYAEMALEVDPSHGFARIVHTFCQAGRVPDWAFAN